MSMYDLDDYNDNRNEMTDDLSYDLHSRADLPSRLHLTWDSKMDVMPDSS
jgi:hypothetical protein